MVRLSRLSTLLALACLAAGTLAACGEGDAELLSGGTAREITANLDSVKRLAGEGDCIGAESAAEQVSEQIDALGGVDEKLKRALREGATRLSEVVVECEEETEAIEPAIVPPEAEADEEGRAEEKERRREEREREKAEDGDEDESPSRKGSPELPPQAEGEAKGREGGGPPGEGEGEAPSGGVAPGSEVSEGD